MSTSQHPPRLTPWCSPSAKAETRVISLPATIGKKFMRWSAISMLAFLLLPTLTSASIPLLEVPAINAAELRIQEQQRKAHSTEKVLRFAEPFEFMATHTEYGHWEKLEKGRSLWSLLVHAPGATDVNLAFADVVLPRNSELRLSTPDGLETAGPYTQRDVSENGQLWTPILPGDFVIIEVEMPEEQQDAFALTVLQVNSGYWDLADWLDSALSKAEKVQGSCNIDVVCPQAAGWENQVRSVGHYTFSGEWVCTGTLVMNQRSDFRPFFLTANHCVSSDSEAQTVVVYWNYQSPTCGALSGGSRSQNQSGARLRATYAAADTTLLELNRQPSSAFNVHYSGWDRSGTAVAGVAGIHHPRGREKAWSYANSTLQSTDYYGSRIDPSATHWRVPFWNQGTTEGGSSGSGLWHGSTRRIVGVLHGGDAACGNTEPDWYGKLSSAWTGGGSAATRLRDWLDPNNTGLTFMDGQDPVAQSTMSPSGGQTVSEIRPTFSWSSVSGATWYQILIHRNGQSHHSSWVQGATWTPSVDGLPGGNYRWWVRSWGPSVGLGGWSNEATFSIPVRRPGAVTQIAPSGAQTTHDLTYRWNRDGNATRYRLVVGRVGGSNFHNRWYQFSGTGEASLTLNNHPGGNLQWWVQPWGPDGLGPWSGPRTFSTPVVAPSKPVLISPSGMLSNPRPTFQWNEDPHAEWYRVRVMRGSTIVVNRWTQETSLVSPIALTAGTYSWSVAAWNSVGGAPVWSDSLGFQIGSAGYLYNITLTWGATPRDLDAHLRVPNGSHVYWRSRGSTTTAPFARLDVDDTTGFGPENIAIYQAYSGIYRYYVHQFSGDGNLVGSGARVRVVNAAGNLLLDRTAPTSGSGRYWYVFDLNAQTGQITLRDQMRTTAP